MNADSFCCELHMHSYYSDGTYSPEYMLTEAAKRGLAVVAITDHDNARGAREAVPIAAELGIELIPAIEFTGRWDGCYRPGWGGDVDILGYFVDLDHPGFCAAEQQALDDIHARMADCCASLTAAGYPVTMQDVWAQNPRYGGSRHVRLALQAKGYAATYEESLTLFTASWQQVRLSSYTIDVLIAAIRAAGGVAVLAHPNAVDCGAGWLSAEQVGELVEMGLDGIEIYHRNMSQEARAYFLPVAQQYHLLISGGSDEHGWSPDLPLMGQQPVTREMVEALRARHQER